MGLNPPKGQGKVLRSFYNRNRRNGQGHPQGTEGRTRGLGGPESPDWRIRLPSRDGGTRARLEGEDAENPEGTLYTSDATAAASTPGAGAYYKAEDAEILTSLNQVSAVQKVSIGVGTRMSESGSSYDGDGSPKKTITISSRTQHNNSSCSSMGPALRSPSPGTLASELALVRPGTEIEESVRAFAETLNMRLVHSNGQRIMGPGIDEHSSEIPDSGTEVFVAKVHRRCTEVDVYPVFRAIGPIYQIRLMMDFSGTNRGFCFVRYYKKEDAQKAVAELNGRHLKGWKLGVVMSTDNARLYLSGFPPHASADEVSAEIQRAVEGVQKVVTVGCTEDDISKKRFCLVAFESHRFASIARRHFLLGNTRLFGVMCRVDWAEPEDNLKTLGLRNLPENLADADIFEICDSVTNGKTMSVKMLQSGCLVDFKSHDGALTALDYFSKNQLDGKNIVASFVKHVREHPVYPRKSRNGRDVSDNYSRIPRRHSVPINIHRQRREPATVVIQQRNHNVQFLQPNQCNNAPTFGIFQRNNWNPQRAYGSHALSHSSIFQRPQLQHQETSFGPFNYNHNQASSYLYQAPPQPQLPQCPQNWIPYQHPAAFNQFSVVGVHQQPSQLTTSSTWTGSNGESNVFNFDPDFINMVQSMSLQDNQQGGYLQTPLMSPFINFQNPSQEAQIAFFENLNNSSADAGTNGLAQYNNDA